MSSRALVADSALVDRLHPSPNVEPRVGGCKPSILLLHYTGLATAEIAIAMLANPAAKVSCHYVIDELGVVTQMVAESLRAWHAGVSSWSGESDINSASIGIEIQNPGHDHGMPDFPWSQMQAVAKLGEDIVRRHGIPRSRVLAHSDVAPSRKSDPGEKFDWAWLARQGVGLWVEPEPVRIDDDSGAPGFAGPEVRLAQEQLVEIGYGIIPTGVVDGETVSVLKAFQRHFRPARVDGRLDHSTRATIARVSTACRADRAGIA